MLNVHEIQLLLLVAAWMVAGGACNCHLEDPCVPLRDDYVNVPGVGAYKFHPIAANWNTARKICIQENAYLAVPNSVAEAKAINTVIANGGTPKDTKNRNDVSIGFHDQFKKGEYITVFGQTLSQAGYDWFSSGEPNNRGGKEHCGAITKLSGRLNDINCNRKYAFVCELALCNSCRSF